MVNDDSKEYRNGPRPLPVHVSFVMNSFIMAQQSEGQKRLVTSMLEGVKKYQSHPFKRQVPDVPVVWETHGVRVQHFSTQNDGAPAFFIVPSLVNKSCVLDLLPDKSFCRWMASQGFHVYLLDWGNPVEHNALDSLDKLMGNALVPAIEFVQKDCSKIHLAGYCMGGTLVAGALSQMANKPDSVIFLASPWDFHAGDRELVAHVRMGMPSALQMIEKSNALPMNWIQSLFAAINADRSMQKFADFAALEEGSKAQQIFIAVEDWLNDGMDLPAAIAQTCILDWYDKNKTGKVKWELNGKAVDLSSFDMPCLVVASKRDRLVPYESSASMTELLPYADLMEPDCGHIGMMTGRKAQTELWEPLAEWLENRR